MSCDPSSPFRPTAAAPPPQTAPPRRVPPPCWTHDETVALIEAYHEKWYSLRRGNLKASHWQDVADAVARRCRLATPSKTSVQCRHKIEKLRKRYRTEKQRALAAPPGRFVSSWVFFRKMDAMEKGPSSGNDSDENGEDDNDDDNEEDDDEDEDDDDEEKNASSRNLHHVMSNGGGSGFRFRIPGGQRSVPGVGSAKLKSFVRVDEKNPNPNNPNSSPNPNFSSGVTRVLNSGAWSRSGGSKREMDPVAEMVSSIRMLGEGFVKMEQMKIEMAREMEQMRMDMEMKRTELILESQRRIVEAFAQGFSVKKKAKRMPSPDS